MLYSLARPIARYVLRYYFRHIDLTGLENIPTEGPVILAANHPTAFIEPCLLACFQRRPLKFLARGNLFWHPLGAAALRGLGILPVFRLKDAGYARLKDNFSTFSACYDELQRGGAIMILAEGSTEHEKRLRPLRKGTARVALGAMNQYPEIKEVPIVPVGVNFTHPEKMRSSVWIRFGPPMRASDFLDRYREQENQGILELTAALRQALIPLVVQIPDPDLDDVAEGLLSISRTDHREATVYGVTHSGDQLNRELAIVAQLPAQTKDREIVRSYGNRLHQLDITDAAWGGSFQPNFQRGVVGWVKSLVAGLLLLWHLPLWALGEFIGGTSTRLITFYSPVRFAAITIGLIGYTGLWLIGLNPWLLAYSILAIVGVRWSLKEWEAGKRWYASRMAWRQPPSERERLKTLRQQARELIKEEKI